MFHLRLATIIALSSPLAGQWLHYPTPGIPRTADGKPNLTAPAPRTAGGKPDFSGLWEEKSNKYYNNIAADLKPSDVRPWAESLYQERKKDFGKNSMEAQCLPMGPAYSTSPYRESKIFQTTTTIVILYDDLRYRQIYMDGRELEKDPNPTWMGYSVAHWDGDTLLVETNGFNESTWLDVDGHPHTEGLHMTERYRRPDFGHIEVQITLDDPKAYIKPLTVVVTMDRKTDTEMLEYVCDNEKDRAHIPSNAKGTDLRVPVETLAAYAGSYTSRRRVRRSSDARSDVFSFGAVLYEMLSGRRAFEGENAVSTMAAVLHKEPRWLDAPPGLERVVMRCLEKQAARRFQTMAELREALGKAAQAGMSVQQQPSIAVLPFANMSADKENEYFSDGLAEEILNLLAKIPGLKVIAHTSSFAFRGKEQDITKIAEALRVQNILEGSVRRAGNRIRVTAQLIHAADGTHLWSERYDRELADVFAVQDEISAAIAQELQLKLSPQAAAKPRYTPKLPAYEALLKAKHFHWKVTRMAQAKEFYEEAIALDPQFALAKALYADYLFGRTASGVTPAHEAMPAIRALAQKALELDPSLSEAHAVLCGLAAAYDYDWKEAARRFTLATASDALSPLALAYLGPFYLVASGRKKEAVDQVERAVQGDPLHPAIRLLMAGCLAVVGRYAEAEMHLRQILDLDQDFALAYYVLANNYAARGMFAEALPFAEKAFSLSPRYPASGIYAGLLVRLGEQDRGREIIQKLGAGEIYGASAVLALFHACCGEIDLAADWFEKAIEERFPSVVYWLQSAMGEPLRASPRWPKLAKMMNLHEEAL